jgi:hypothetical protein
MKKQILTYLLFWLLSFSISPFYANVLVNKTEITCTAPTTQPTNLTFVNTFSDYTFASFTATTADGYLAVVSTSATLSALPENGVNYATGDALGTATVVSSSSATALPIYGLSPESTYYVFVFAYNNAGCGSTIHYNTTTPLSSSVSTTTASSFLPTAQPSNLVFNSSTGTTISGSFTSAEAHSYLVVISTFSNLKATPVAQSAYTIGNTIGNGKVVSVGSSTSFVATGLLSNTTYYVFVFAYSSPSCNCGVVYRTHAPLNGSTTTIAPPCMAPVGQPSGLVFSNPTTTGVSGSFAGTTANHYLVVYSTASTLSTPPTNGTVYSTGTTLGNGTVLSVTNTTIFDASGLIGGMTYYFTIFALNDVACSNGPVYNIVTPLTGSVTITPSSLNYYFGNLHSHSEYSDGTGLPSGDFAYGDAASCMDFLGISEHNHVSAGMALANWSLGRAQAAAATTPTFLALYGMEWGVISGGGHVIVYGVPNLLGWDAGQYETYVAKNDYIGVAGLFTTINGYGGNAIATLAHPNNADYGGIMSTYNATADLAIVGTAVESGPATSTNTTYSDPGTAMSYLSYYRNMLARGYHLGPTVDHDNHNVTHGHTTLSRTVVLAPSLTEDNILGAMKQMHFYASEDCSAYVTFKVNDAILGSDVSSSGAPNITVTTTTSNSVTSLKIYSGVPGSGTNATILTSTTTGAINYNDTALTTGNSRYYYIDITESDGKRVITAPIWYTRVP